MGRSVRIAIVLCALGGAAIARPPDFAARAAVQESLAGVHPRFRADWLRQRGLDNSDYTTFRRPDSGAGLRLVGRWSYGPATFCMTEVIGVDTVVFLSRGSGVSIVRFRSQDSLSLELLADINCDHLTGRLVVKDGLLCVGSAGLEVYDIADLRSPVRTATFPFVAYDHAIRDTFLYVVNSESLRIYSIADQQAVRFLGGCRDSGYAMCVSDGYAYLGHSSGLYIVDVANPASPHRVGSAAQDVIALDVRDTLCYLTTTSQGLKVYNVRDPAAPALVGSLGGLPATTLYLPPTCDTVLYTPVFHAISIADPRNPRIIGQVAAPGWDYWVTAVPALNYALVADYYEGLVAIDVTNPVLPTYAGQSFAADMATDVFLDGGRAYVASSKAGMRILDVTDPTRPTTLGGVDTLWNGVLCPSVAAKDSFAFMGLRRPWFRSVDVTDPARPLLAGACTTSTEAQDMVVRDSLVYCAINYQFAVVNIARPRAPQVVGTLNLGNLTSGMRMMDSLAYVCSYPLAIINTADPTHPTQVGSIPRGAWNVFVKDSFAFLAAAGLIVWNVTDPGQPFVIDSLGFGKMVYDVLIRDTIAYLACSDGLRTASVANVHDMRVTGYAPLPYYGWRLADDSAHIYVAVRDAGICVFDTAVTGVAEPDRRTAPVALRVTPRVSAGRFQIETTMAGTAAIYDAGGRRIAEVEVGAELDISASPDGVYVVVVPSRSGTSSAKVVKIGR
jgi:hypothetical protein